MEEMGLSIYSPQNEGIRKALYMIMKEVAPYVDGEKDVAEYKPFSSKTKAEIDFIRQETMNVPVGVLIRAFENLSGARMVDKPGMKTILNKVFACLHSDYLQVRERGELRLSVYPERDGAEIILLEAFTLQAKAGYFAKNPNDFPVLEPDSRIMAKSLLKKVSLLSILKELDGVNAYFDDEYFPVREVGRFINAERNRVPKPDEWCCHNVIVDKRAKIQLLHVILNVYDNMEQDGVQGEELKNLVESQEIRRNTYIRRLIKSKAGRIFPPKKRKFTVNCSRSRGDDGMDCVSF